VSASVGYIAVWPAALRQWVEVPADAVVRAGSESVQEGVVGGGQGSLDRTVVGPWSREAWSTGWS
jgi:hypothetical protein